MNELFIFYFKAVDYEDLLIVYMLVPGVVVYYAWVEGSMPKQFTG